ncbi:hypothetical protein E2P81_ATG00469 [Venturia nashicola]|nr:hypothetical protein E2P81_ATG00469 [Venturia nashicola]
MPLTVETQHRSTDAATPQAQAESEQTALAWAQAGWWQQQLGNGSYWTLVDEINADEAIGAEQDEASAYHPSGLSPSVVWNGRRGQQDTDNEACDQTNGPMAPWASPVTDGYWQTSIYDMPTTPGSSEVFLAGDGQQSATLPLFLKSADLQIPESPSATSSSFSPDLQMPPFQFNSLAEPSSRRTSLKRSPSSELNGSTVEVEYLVKPKPKRGRPRLPRNEPHVCDDFPCEHVIEESGSRRVPHNQVEKKYRNGLNAEMERLRATVAAAPSRAFAHLSSSSTKPSKAMVLTSAIDYIESIKAERDQLARENEALRGKNKKARREKRVTE